MPSRADTAQRKDLRRTLPSGHPLLAVLPHRWLESLLQGHQVLQRLVRQARQLVALLVEFSVPA